VHTLISRPAVSASPLLQSRSNPSILSLASSSKRIIQIALLLAERKMTFSFCMNEREMLQESIVGVLFQAIALGPESALFREDWKLMMAACDRLESHAVRGSREFRELLANLASDGTQMTKEINISRESGTNPTSNFVEGKRLETLEAKRNGHHRQRMNLSHERRTYLCLAQPSTQADASFLGHSTLNYAPQFARSEPTLSPILQRVGEENMSSYVTTLNLDYMTFSMSNRTSSIPLNHADRTHGSEPTDWTKLLSDLDNRKDIIHERINRSSRCQPPSLGDYSSLASSSPKALNSANSIDAAAARDIFAPQPCSPSEPWPSDLDFSINAPYFLRQRGVKLVFNDNDDPKLSSGADVAIPPELSDDELIRIAAVPNESSPLATGTLGDVELFGVDLSLAI
jgi:hypothetical protein